MNELTRPISSSIILAAGCSKRLGQEKQWVTIGEKNLLTLACEQALKVSSKVFVVLGFRADEMMLSLNELDVEPLINHNWSTGLASSIQVGLKAVSSSPTMIMLCDQPKINDEHYQNLVNLHYANEHKIIASKYAKRFGVPAIFSPAYYDELNQLTGDAGARSVLQKHSADLISLDCDAALFDVDTAEDLTRLALSTNN